MNFAPEAPGGVRADARAEHRLHKTPVMVEQDARAIILLPLAIAVCPRRTTTATEKTEARLRSPGRCIQTDSCAGDPAGGRGHDESNNAPTLSWARANRGNPWFIQTILFLLAQAGGSGPSLFYLCDIITTLNGDCVHDFRVDAERCPRHLLSDISVLGSQAALLVDSTYFCILPWGHIPGGNIVCTIKTLLFTNCIDALFRQCFVILFFFLFTACKFNFNMWLYQIPITSK